MGAKVEKFLMFLLVGLICATSVHAQTYYPPNKIHCSMDAGALVCEGFSREYLEEDETNADKMDVSSEFVFKVGEAHYSMRHDMCYLTYTYANKLQQTVRLRRKLHWIRPDFENGHWNFVDSWYVVCSDGAKLCPLSVSTDTYNHSWR